MQRVIPALVQANGDSIDMARKFAEETGMATHEVDQLYARLLSEMGLQDGFDEDSPWHDLDEG